MSSSGDFDRVLGSMHCLPDGTGYAEPWTLFKHRPADTVVRDYLVEVARMVSMSSEFEVPAHIDYPVRYWPAAAGPFQIESFEAEFRLALGALTLIHRLVCAFGGS